MGRGAGGARRGRWQAGSSVDELDVVGIVVVVTMGRAIFVEAMIGRATIVVVVTGAG